MTNHTSVLLEEVLALFRGKSLTTFIDATVGAGGHTEAIMREHPELQRVIGFDQDSTALALARKRLENVSSRVDFVESSFLHLSERCHNLNITSAEGILFDLGVSSMQLDTAGRGMSFLHEGPLDMRMSTSQDITAADIVNSYREDELADIFYHYGEEWRSRPIAKAIVQFRKKQRITTTLQLAQIITSVYGGRGKTHPATKVFQALRIAVNDELEVLKKALPQALSLLAPGGRLAVISFHSLEDRIVKHTFAQWCKEHPSYTLVMKKPLVPSWEETKVNRRSRSAKLRAVERSC